MEFLHESLPTGPVPARRDLIRLGFERREDGGPVRHRGRLEPVGVALPDAGGIAPDLQIGSALEEFELVLDQARDGAVGAFGFLAEGGELEGLHQFALFIGGEGGAFEEILEDEVVLRVFQGLHDGERSADADFEAERGEDLQEEGVEGADAELREGADETAEGGLRGRVRGETGQAGLGELPAQAAVPRIGSGGLGEAGEDAREDFAGGLAGEGERDDGGGIGSGGKQGEVAVAEGEGLAGAGGGGEGGIADGEGRAHGRRGSSDERCVRTQKKRKIVVGGRKRFRRPEATGADVAHDGAGRIDGGGIQVRAVLGRKSSSTIRVSPTALGRLK